MASRVIPTMRYADARRMLDWLCEVFGFERHAVHEDEEGRVAHAELTLGDGMIMLGTEADDAFGRHQRTPKSLGGTTQSPYLVVADADTVHARAVAAGAEIVMPLQDRPYGSREFSCRDPEGHLWNVGTYDPWAAR
jgi:uncharacterized glyoxalase superfamily protein PhnB